MCELEQGFLKGYNSSKPNGLKHVLIFNQDIRNVSTQVGALQQALRSAHEDAMTRSQETFLVQETNAVAQKDLASSLHLSLESLLDSDMDKVYQGMQKFEAAMVCQNICTI